jgi:hypothetical protein
LSGPLHRGLKTVPQFAHVGPPRLRPGKGAPLPKPRQHTQGGPWAAFGRCRRSVGACELARGHQAARCGPASVRRRLTDRTRVAVNLDANGVRVELVAGGTEADAAAARRVRPKQSGAPRANRDRVKFFE